MDYTRYSNPGGVRPPLGFIVVGAVHAASESAQQPLSASLRVPWPPAQEWFGHRRDPLMFPCRIPGGRVRRVWALVLAVVALVLVGAGPAAAEDPVRLDTQVTDLVGVLPAGRPGVDEALSRLRTATDTRLFVVFVSTFGTDTTKDWAAEAAALSSLQASDVLVAVAVNDRHFEWWVDDSSPLTEPQVTALLTTQVEPRIVAGDWAGTVVAAAHGFRAQLPTRPTADPSTQWSGRTTALVGAAVLVSLVGGHLLSRWTGRLRAAE